MSNYDIYPLGFKNEFLLVKRRRCEVPHLFNDIKNELAAVQLPPELKRGKPYTNAMLVFIVWSASVGTESRAEQVQNKTFGHASAETQAHAEQRILFPYSKNPIT